ncbi:MAG: hypothetical protein P0Y59_02750 [Candidatus Sphingomonas phytovorans]|nr:hypothetical protein [Sphingomonas sp.]WEK02478.1 MAG: hypothetical protein P0Y59_02750 [Sphingomonas sp.]
MTPHQIATLDFVRSHIERMGFAPTYPEIAQHFRISTPSAFNRVEQLIDQGHLRKSIARRRGLELAGTDDLRAVPSSVLRSELERRGETVGALTGRPWRTMNSRAVTCAVDCCDIEVKLGHLMCRDHWRSLPWDLRQDIFAAHASAKRTRLSDDADAYGELVRQARELAAGRIAA